MKPSVEEIGKLLAMKRHEVPPEGYLEDFLREFHYRRREESMQREGLREWWSRFAEWIGEPGAAKWMYGAGAAYAVALAILVVAPREQSVSGPPREAVSYQVMEPAKVSLRDEAGQLEALDLRPTTEARAGEQEF